MNILKLSAFVILFGSLALAASANQHAQASRPYRGSGVQSQPRGGNYQIASDPYLKVDHQSNPPATTHSEDHKH